MRPIPFEQLVGRLRERLPDLTAVYGFGSAGTENERPDSDVDLAVLLPRKLDPVVCWELAQELATLAGADVDLVDLLAASTVLRLQVVARGSRLFCGDPYACAVFEDAAFSSYARLNEERREILRDIQYRGQVYA